jgi:hypothetical protein
MCRQTGYAFVDERQKRMDEVTRGTNQQAHINEEVPEGSTSASNRKCELTSKR